MAEDDPLHALHAKLVADEAAAEELLLFHVRTLRELRDGLMEANRSRGGKSAVWDRVAVHQALHATNRFLRAHDMQDLSSPLVLLEGALLDLEHGLIPAMLRPRAEGDRKPPSLKAAPRLCGGDHGRADGHAACPDPRPRNGCQGSSVRPGRKLSPIQSLAGGRRLVTTKATPSFARPIAPSSTCRNG